MSQQSAQTQEPAATVRQSARRGARCGAGGPRAGGAGGRTHLHALAELANLAVDDVTFLLRDVCLLQNARRLRDGLLCGNRHVTTRHAHACTKCKQNSCIWTIVI